ncbi:universal stress protein [Aldersonia sp. NBC_00410]|uniref:universal stress protein n=1 Tax=Aldersonia sp. NBC_00410 TaxID=2975954 RepID=UPI00224EB1B2|nr:universal stress protein [Aldersonia sp. NBC_00410]MCX5044764.1 universal stress protein [Aldersonia sp. NBC_00410]
MTSNMQTKRLDILVGVDGSAAATAAVRYAAQLASARKRPLRIVYGIGLADMGWVYGTDYGAVPSIEYELRLAGKRILADATALARTIDDSLDIIAEVSPQPPARLLVDLSEHAYLVVVGGSGTGRLGAVASTAVAVTSHAHTPVIVVRTAAADDAPAATGSVVVGVDGSAVSDHAIGVAFEEASRRNANLVAVHTWSDTAFSTGDFAGDRGLLTPPIEFETIEHAVLAERLAGWQEKYPDVRVERRIYPDAPRERLLDLSDEAQLLVVGSRGRGGFRGLLLGSTSNALVVHARCPVMVVRPPCEP